MLGAQRGRKFADWCTLSSTGGASAAGHASLTQDWEAVVKFLVLWSLDISLLSREMVRAVGDMPAYGARLERDGKVLARYHMVGAHGGAWIYEVESHEEFERLLGRAPVFNFARYTVHALAEMESSALPLQDQLDIDEGTADQVGLGLATRSGVRPASRQRARRATD